jgi:prepilin-type processing-associated H-X9-DG protein
MSNAIRRTGSPDSGQGGEHPAVSDEPVLRIGSDGDGEARIGSPWAWACLILGCCGLIIALVTRADLPNRLHIPRSISKVTESHRTLSWYLASLGAALLALGADFTARRAAQGRAFRLVGVLCAVVTATVLVEALLSSERSVWPEGSGSRALCTNNLKQIELALYNYESAFGALPPRVLRDRQGRPLLSWRVLILPYLEQEELYSRFHLDEPWDSPHNRPLIDSMPSLLRCPGQAAWTATQTVYQVLDGPGVFLDGSEPTRWAQITDDRGATISIVESSVPVPWTSPQDVPFSLNRPFKGWEATHPGGINCALADGSVKFLKATIRASVFKALATRAGGERISRDSY